ncbi:hypothetical protein McanMca71_004583 [Microsporum canis]|uniref:RTA1 domain-containing protein n=1 Tax=Arthroderma otae (strain ATCC MYA-4605 / CBS 113480) TaxID=554155 RepID=C5FN66_ARTOC|nr:conserved hypothetical protein [Microsporum canis CBS 113480]EEQ31302.1 conserved hypothetical protein [Microsporum canis CBS 113480]
MAPSFATCTEVGPACPVEATTYGYYPQLGPNAFLTAFFALLALIQLGLGVFTRTWSFLIAVFMACALESVGYGGRLLMNKNPWSKDAFQIQIVCLILAPTFLAAGVYLTIKHIILFVGPEHSRIKPKLYTWVFILCDIGSLILQSAGGGVAAAATKSNFKLLNVGNGIIIAGIAFQVATMSVCGLLALEFFIRAYRSGQGFSKSSSHGAAAHRSFWIFCAADAFAYVAILIRCIYRLPEMAGGWGNPLMRNEKDFLLLDGMMIALASATFTVFHPGFWFPPMRKGGLSKDAQFVPPSEGTSVNDSTEK